MLLAVAWPDILFVFNKLSKVYFCKHYTVNMLL